MSVIEKVSSISNELANILDFAAKNETIKTDFENYIKPSALTMHPNQKFIRCLSATFLSVF